MDEGDDSVEVLVDGESGVAIDTTTETSLLMALEFTELCNMTAAEAGFATRHEGEDSDVECDSPSKAMEDYVADVDDDFSRHNSWERQETEDLHIQDILRKTKFQGELCYLVKYRTVEEPIWEKAQFLLDEGHLPLLEAFDRRAKELKAAAASKAKREERKNYAQELSSKYNTDGLFNLVKYFPNIIENVVARFRESNSNRRVTRIDFFKPKDIEVPLQRFTDLHNKKEHATVDYLFHGTRSSNHPSIISKGLLVPGTDGVSVVNGSALGVGIYSARSPSIPFGYTRDCEKMFLLGGLINSNVVMDPSKNVCVFFNAAQVCPIAMISYAHGEQTDSVQVGVNGSTIVYQVSGFLSRAYPNSYVPRAGPRVVVDRGQNAVQRRFKFMTKRELKS
eukprot:PhF_6_TR43155/c0_g1_i1/m.66075